MDNYKIKVTDEAESKEAQELFFELGYEWRDSKRDITNLDVVFIYAKDGVLTAGFNDHNFAEAGHKELTLPQLRDLVVLKRNDVKDANYIYAGNPVLKLETQDYKVWDEAKQAWLEHVGSQTDLRRGLKAIPKRPETATGRFDENGEHHLTFSNGTEEKAIALISGAEALRALADGKEVEYNWLNQKSSKWMLISEELKQFNLYEILSGITEFGAIKFRLKPQTIKLELELPKPFEPKDGETYWHIYPSAEKGYHFVRSFEDDDVWCQFGAWRTEAEVKQVVEQLRKIRGTNS
ncbi:TPA: hypothetical protein JI136_07720 [Acinetobacter baumannii]|nr:hypothetical protein [Acinetobacter baumannii]HAV5726328.1 hypothetical protein [Acinetobacter baumannii]HAV5728894.1 hypothetical protein [Acinetobacter baumannii]